MKTKLTACLLFSALFISIISVFSVFSISVRAAEVSAGVTVAQVSANPGENAVIPITLETNPGMAAFKIKVEYDSSRLKIENQSYVAKGTALGNLSYMGVNESTAKNNPFTILWYGSWNDSSTGVLINVTFTVLENAPAGEAFVKVICDPGDAVQSSGAKVSVSAQNAGVTVVSQQPEPENTGTKPTTPSTPSNPSNPGSNIIYIPENVPQTTTEQKQEEQKQDQEQEKQEKQNPENFTERINKLYNNAGTKIKFSDVPEKEWFFEAVSFVSSRALFIGVGDGLFMPKGTMTRGMFLTVLARLDGADLSKYKVSPYSDTDIKLWYGQSVAWAAEAKIIDSGILSGCEPGTFLPGSEVKREEMAAMFANYIKYKNLPLKAGKTPEFADIGEASAWAREPINAMRSLGIINGIGDNLYNPKGAASRAEVAQIFKNLIYAIAGK